MEILNRINQLFSCDEPFCLATVVVSPSLQQGILGSKVIIHSDGSTEFTTGSDEIDRLIALAAQRSFKEHKKMTIEVAQGLQVFFDLPARNRQLVICGAGHIAVPLARYARDVGFNVAVIDDREDFANGERFPSCEVVAEEFIPALRKVAYGSATYVVVITRGHEHDADCLSEVLRHETGYVGLIGSRRRVRFVLEMLGRQGVAQEKLTEVFTPIGIPIGAESPEEIALSIMAELVCVRRKGAQQAITLRQSLWSHS